MIWIMPDQFFTQLSLSDLRGSIHVGGFDLGSEVQGFSSGM